MNNWHNWRLRDWLLVAVQGAVLLLIAVSVLYAVMGWGDSGYNAATDCIRFVCS